MTSSASSERTLAIAGIVLFVVTFLSWYGVSVPDVKGVDTSALLAASGVDTTANAWQAFDWIDLLMLVTAVAAIAPAALRLAGQNVGFDFKQAAAGLGVASAVLVAYRILNEPGPDKLIDVKYGAWLGLLACIGVAVTAAQARRA